MVTQADERRLTKAIGELDQLARALSLLLVAVIESLVANETITRADIGRELLEAKEDLQEFLQSIAEDN